MNWKHKGLIVLCIKFPTPQMILSSEGHSHKYGVMCFSQQEGDMLNRLGTIANN